MGGPGDYRSQFDLPPPLVSKSRVRFGNLAKDNVMASRSRPLSADSPIASHRISATQWKPRPVRGGDHAFYRDQFLKSLRAGCERENRSAVLFKVDLANHLAPGRLISCPEYDLVAPSSGIACRFHGVRQ